ncbi:MAG: PKD domain-containing protein [Planctomycetota bacterium]
MALRSLLPAGLLPVGLLIVWAGGCGPLLGSLMTPPREGVEWNREREFSYYVPTNYDRELAWPLVIVCHGGFPDSAKSHIQYWTEEAETKGFIVAAPRLDSPGKFGQGMSGDHLERVRSDEQRILATIQSLRGAYNVSEDRIFLHGWSAGAPVAMHTGLKFPEVFRAVSILQPKFDSTYMADIQHRIDRGQPIYVDYSGVDSLTGDNARKCLDWLYEKHANVQEHSLGPARAASTSRCVSFYESIIRRSTWMHVRAFPASDNNPLAVRFQVKTTESPVRYKWKFGDGDESPVAEPLHVFPAQGTYRVTVTIYTEAGRRGSRIVNVEVPGAKLVVDTQG